MTHCCFIGPPKTGTTSLWSAFGRHPDVSVSTEKEPLYFLNGYHNDERLYLDQFDFSRKVTADFQPKNCLYPWVADRIVETMGLDTHIFITVREPIARLYSEMNHWRNMRPGRLQNGSFSEIVKRNIESYDSDKFPDEGSFMMQSDPRGGNYLESYLEFSGYLSHFLRYSKFTTHVILFDDLFLKGQEVSDDTMASICKIMGIPPITIDVSKKLNSQTVSGFGRNDYDDNLLMDFFQEDIKALSEITNIDFNKEWYCDEKAK